MNLVVSNRVVSNAEYFKGPWELVNYLKRNPNIQKILFFCWSWIVPKEILDKYECYGMHTGPLLEGKGRGGDPIGNLQQLGVRITTLCAFKMTEKLDGGQVKVAIPFYLDGTKEELIERAAGYLPMISDYLFEKQPEIPETFKRADVRK